MGNEGPCGNAGGLAPGFRFGCLRALEGRDVAGMLEWMRDAGVSSVFQRDFADVGEGEALAFVEASRVSREAVHFAVPGEGDEYMGTVSLKAVDLRNQQAEYAISMRACAHGTGLAMRATLDVLRYAFEEMGLHRVYLCVRSDNLRAIRFYGKVGFVHEGTSREALLADGGYVDLEWYAVLSSDALGGEVAVSSGLEGTAPRAPGANRGAGFSSRGC